MRSGTGRHRRPRQAPAFIVAAGVTGAGMALPLMSAGTAEAVSDEAWDRAAECESGGLWSANTGNGYYGGFQLTLGMWEQYGGTEFADRPDLASRAQQIAVLDRLLADQGQDALPGCALLSGLWEEYRQEPGEEIDRAEEAEEAQAEEEIGGPEELAVPGETSVEEPSAPPAEEPTAPAEQAPREVPEEAPEEAPREVPEQAPEEATGEADGLGPGSGRHRGDPDPSEAGAEAAAPGGGGRHADRHEVRRGDTLSAIAVEYGVRGGWPALYAANETVIGDNPDHILPGQELDLTVTAR